MDLVNCVSLIHLSWVFSSNGFDELGLAGSFALSLRFRWFGELDLSDFFYEFLFWWIWIIWRIESCFYGFVYYIKFWTILCIYSLRILSSICSCDLMFPYVGIRFFIQYRMGTRCSTRKGFDTLHFKIRSSCFIWKWGNDLQGEIVFWEFWDFVSKLKIYAFWNWRKILCFIFFMQGLS